MQRAYGQPEQVVMTLPLLIGTDGHMKMSKSYGNYIGVTDAPEDMYGKTLSIPDELLGNWYTLLLGADPPAGLGPRDAKRALARAIVERFHDAEAARAAEEAFDRVHIRHELPDDVPTLQWRLNGGSVHLPALLAEAFGISTSEARRNLAQGAVRVDGQVLPPDALDVGAGSARGPRPAARQAALCARDLPRSSPTHPVSSRPRP